MAGGGISRNREGASEWVEDGGQSAMWVKSPHRLFAQGASPAWPDDAKSNERRGIKPALAIERREQRMAKPSYEGLTTRELKDLDRQWTRQLAKGRVRCEAGHDGCGCSPFDGASPCHEEVVKELRWRNAPSETVEVE